jgi:hypothetical protein
MEIPPNLPMPSGASAPCPVRLLALSDRPPPPLLHPFFPDPRKLPLDTLPYLGLKWGYSLS